MATIEVGEDTKRTVAFAAMIANVSEDEIIRRAISSNSLADSASRVSPDAGQPIYADYDGRRTRALYYPRHA